MKILRIDFFIIFGILIAYVDSENSCFILILKEKMSVLIFNNVYFIKDTLNPSQLFTSIIRCSRLPLWIGYFIYSKFTCVSSIVYQSPHL